VKSEAKVQCEAGRRRGESDDDEMRKAAEERRKNTSDRSLPVPLSGVKALLV
jgi:hypothetical protein